MTEATTGSEDAIAFLERQHEEIRRLFNQVQEAGGEDKAEAFQCLVRMLAVHETAEEMVVHPVARRADGAEEVVDARLEEENKAKRALADLEKMGPADPEFDAHLQVFRADVDRHATHEENQEFPLLRASLDADTLRAMTDQLRMAESIAPTHPHPHGPESAVGNLVVGPFASIADRVRDALKSD
ncbi:MAG: hemerythrin cation binding protein [Acidimicrobiales bacterium]|nr:hemerythrin cation binding protein [Acidimicrobiales bacterium]